MTPTGHTGITDRKSKMSDQTRRVAIVTGAAGGIGSAITHRLEKYGVDVLAVDLDRSATQQSTGSAGIAFAADLTTREGNENAVRAALDEFGRLDMDRPMRTTTYPPGISNAALESAFGGHEAVLRGGTTGS